MKKTRNMLLPIAAAIALVACGGGSSNDSGTDTQLGTSGRAVDGYLSGATAFCDTNGNGVLDAGEMSTTTDGDGRYGFSALCDANVGVFGGIDTATGYTFRGLMKTPAGGTYVTPLTTLLADTGMTPTQLANSLGLDAGIDVTKTDPMAPGNAVLLKKSLAVQQIIQQLANYFGTLTSPDDVPGLYAQAAHTLGSVLLASPGTPLVGANGEVNATLLTAAVQQTITELESGSVIPAGSVSVADVTDLVTQLVQETEQFLQALEADLITLAKNLQNPLKPPVDTDTAKKNYVSPLNDSFQINGQTYTLDAFSDGITVNGLDKIAVDYTVTGNPKINVAVDTGFIVTEVGGSRILQVKIEQLHLHRDNVTGELTLSYTPDTQVHIFARDGQGSTFNATVQDVTFDPITITNNRLTVDYAKFVNRVTNDAQNDTVFKAEHFQNPTGTFDVKLVVSNNFNVRYEDGTPLPVAQVGIFNTEKGVMGPGVGGRLTINPVVN